MDNAMNHALEWKRALDAKSITNTNSPDQQIIDTVIGYERKMAWMSIAHQVMEFSDPLNTLVTALNHHVPSESATQIATSLIAVACAEKTGKEVTVEVFNNIFKIDV